MQRSRQQAFVALFCMLLYMPDEIRHHLNVWPYCVLLLLHTKCVVAYPAGIEGRLHNQISSTRKPEDYNYLGMRSALVYSPLCLCMLDQCVLVCL